MFNAGRKWISLNHKVSEVGGYRRHWLPSILTKRVHCSRTPSDHSSGRTGAYNPFFIGALRSYIQLYAFQQAVPFPRSGGGDVNTNLNFAGRTVPSNLLSDANGDNLQAAMAFRSTFL
ncbi:Hypothetical predicted protein [Podarcis lilfordi]|uniref:Uncharacterized protein n=1 Tax=Podarcis lilfordi TaxID=74358 RepID=A0AA35JUX4_9SAUR|nr:Hypothetical predicted protein [Podarcis lilfordi]